MNFSLVRLRPGGFDCSSCRVRLVSGLIVSASSLEMSLTVDSTCATISVVGILVGSKNERKKDDHIRMVLNSVTSHQSSDKSLATTWKIKGEERTTSEPIKTTNLSYKYPEH